MATFTWTPSVSSSVASQPRIRSMRFGDGYEQRAADGINANLARWAVTFENRSDAEAQAIADFLAARGGVEAFDWAPPGGSATKWLCRSWRRRFHGVASSIEGEFEQVPA